VNPAWVAALVTLTTAVAGLVYWLMRTVWHLFQRLDEFFEDWKGRPATPGHPARPGVMERLAALEGALAQFNDRLDTQDSDLNTIKSEVTFNSGHSIKDVVRDIQQKINRLQPPTP
jgi:hypothetical protein